jgi:hypothetical protein
MTLISSLLMVGVSTLTSRSRASTATLAKYFPDTATLGG